MNEEPPTGGSQEQPGEEELRTRLEEELRKIKVRDVVVQTVVTLINLGGQRLGLTEATIDARDLEQTRLAIEAVRLLLPLLEGDSQGADQVRPVRDALAQLQMAYAREVEVSGERSPGEAEARGAGEKREPEQPAPPKPSGRLWVPPGSAS